MRLLLAIWTLREGIKSKLEKSTEEASRRYKPKSLRNKTTTIREIFVPAHEVLNVPHVLGIQDKIDFRPGEE
jgi:hypothetical protein